MVKVFLLSIFDDGAEQSNLFLINDRLFHKNHQLPEFRYGEVLRLIFLNTCRRFRKLQRIPDVHFPMLSANLLLSRQLSFLFHHHRQLLLTSPGNQILWQSEVLVRRILKSQQIPAHTELLLLSLWLLPKLCLPFYQSFLAKHQ